MYQPRHQGRHDAHADRGQEAVACGYWHLWHYNPQLEEQGKNPFVMDSKEPDWSKFRDFLMKEVRYTSLKKSFPAEAEAVRCR